MSIDAVLADLESNFEERRDLYIWFHQHPELSMEEFETSKKIEEVLESYGVEVVRTGKTGLVAIVRNGEGPTVAMRADFDALPVKEVSGKEYTATGDAAHACGHDFHVIGLLGAIQALNDHKDEWSGTFMGVFQPGEETAAGAQDMVDGGIVDKVPTPDVYLGQHVMGSIPGGTIATKVGPILTEAKSIEIKIQGKGSHGSMPHLGVDPVVVGAAIVTRLQSIVAREVPPSETAVVTVGSFQSGAKSNIIPDSATLLLNTRAYNADVAKHLHAAIERIAIKECEAANTPEPPQIRYYDEFPLTDNDADVTSKVRKAFDAYFGDAVNDASPAPASEDFSRVANAFGVPYTYWFIGGFADYTTAPGNHNPAFAPDIEPTLDLGVKTIVVAASAWLMED